MSRKDLEWSTPEPDTGSPEATLAFFSSGSAKESMENYLVYMRECPLFQDTTNEVVTVFLIAARIRRVHKGEQFFSSTEPATALYMLVRGRVNLSHDFGLGFESEANWIEPSQPFGLAALVGSANYDDYAIADEDCAALYWERDIFQNLLAHYLAALAENIFRYLYTRIVFYHEQWAITNGRVDKRLASTLYRLAENPRFATHGPTGIKVSVTQNNLAIHIGAHYSTISRILGRWEQEGLVKPGRGYIILRRLELIALIADHGDNQAPPAFD